jgi:hypothetical protein
MLLLWIAFGLLCNHIVGYTVLSWIDSDDLELLEWVESAPRWWLKLLPVAFWPVTAWFYILLRE